LHNGLRMKQHNLSDAQISAISSVNAHLFTQALSINGITDDVIKQFQETIYNYYRLFRRDFAWRQTTNPYHIVVSEIMLQQTQTSRVQGKYENFITQFPDFATLASAQMRDLLAAWQGLGYNRRALALQKIAQRVMHEFDGKLPDDPEILQTFSGIGPNTAGSICAFAFNCPITFIETNIRSIFIHFFFQGQTEVHDKMLLPLVAKTVDRHNAREWYYALMDYGVALKKMYPNPSRKSVHHATQSKFEGSDRQIRGAILRLLTKHVLITEQDLLCAFPSDEQRVIDIAHDLAKDGFIRLEKGHVSLK